MPQAHAQSAEEDDLLRQLAVIGAPCEPTENSHSGNDSFREAGPDGKVRFAQETQVSGGGDALRCPVPLPAPSNARLPTTSVTLSDPPTEVELAALQDQLDGTMGKAPTSSSRLAEDRHLARLGAIYKNQKKNAGATATICTITFPATPKPANTNVKMPLPWARLSEAGRLYASARYCQVKGGVAVSLNLHNDTAARYTSGQLKTKITDLFRGALRRRLHAAGIVGLPYYLMFELSPAGELHLHGVLDLHDRSQDEIDAIKLALRQAAGQIKGRAAGRQLHLKVIWNGNGWAKYMLKARKIAQARLNLDSLKVSSHEMSDRARNYHDQARKLSIAA